MKTRLSLSVALASYNGERYILQQLDSIANQTRLPDELIISDDASVDATPEIARDFALHAPFPVRLLRNSERLGSTRNFETAIRACCGDIIFLCDQDDVWRPDKIALIEGCFINNPQTGAVFTDGDVVDENLHPVGRLWEIFGFNPKEQRMVAAGNALEVLLRHSVVTGATMAFRSTFRDLVLPLPDLANIWHDAWIALLIGTVSRLDALSAPSIAYRQHGANQVGIRRPGKNRGKTFAAIYGPRVLHLKMTCTRLIECADRFPVDEQKIQNIDEALTFLRTRTALPVARWRRLGSALHELAAMRYHRYAYGLKSFGTDLFR